MSAEKLILALNQITIKMSIPSYTVSVLIIKEKKINISAEYFYKCSYVRKPCHRNTTDDSGLSNFTTSSLFNFRSGKWSVSPSLLCFSKMEPFPIPPHVKEKRKKKEPSSFWLQLIKEALNLFFFLPRLRCYSCDSKAWDDISFGQLIATQHLRKIFVHSEKTNHEFS